MSSNRHRQSKQHNQEDPDQEKSCNNALLYKRGECPCVTDAEMDIRRQKQRLMSVGGVQPSCTDFGVDRKELYPGFYFCQQCDDWDNPTFENKRLKQTNKRYKCRAGHTSFIAPTTKMKTWCSDHVRKRADNIAASEQERTDDDVESEVGAETQMTLELASFPTWSSFDDSASTIASVTTQDNDANLHTELRELRKENDTMKERLVNEILELRKEKEKLQRDVSRLNRIIRSIVKYLGNQNRLLKV